MSIVADFAKYRKTKQSSFVAGPAFETPTAPDIQSINDFEEIKKLLMEDEQFKGFVTPDPRFFGNGAGVSPSRVAGLESRLNALEQDGASASVNYLQITDTGTTTYNEELVTGINIIGVNANGAVTIRLPNNLSPGTIIEVNDESLAAGTNNITIETYIVETV